MNRTKEGGPYVSLDDIDEAINSLNLPVILLEKIASRIDEIPLDDVYTNLSDEKKEEIEDKVAEKLKKGLREEVTNELEDEYGQLFDEYVGLVVRTLFDIKLNDLKPFEQREIEEIRNKLKIPGSFNPDA